MKLMEDKVTLESSHDKDSMYDDYFELADGKSEFEKIQFLIAIVLENFCEFLDFL